ncbi:AAA family ATPase [Kitasatospora sp. NPDC096204]|uniref:AAA family ATPase n=1 Tax=Kitasatospora sp. NPDC096204 TaxID=3364094 RepID=UPI00381D4B52
MKSFVPSRMVQKISFDKNAKFPDLSVDLAPLTIVCGPHGSGKSTILSYIAEGLLRGATHEDHPPFMGARRAPGPKTLAGSCTLDLHINGEHKVVVRDLEKSVKYGESWPDLDLYPIIYTPLATPADIHVFFQDMISDFTEYREGGEIVQKQADLSALRDILGISYAEVIYFPVRTDTHGPVEPYVKARSGSKWISSYDMSYGELYVHKLRWEMQYSRDSVFIIDEPEAHISPRGQAALMDEIARLARAYDTQVIIATHSPDFIQRVPVEWVRACVRSPSGSLIFKPRNLSDIRELLGREPRVSGLLLVEDEVAAATLRMILSAASFPRMSELEIVPSGAWQDLVLAESALSNAKRLRVVAVLDGDQRNNPKIANHLSFLPGEEAPEKVFVGYAIGRPSELAERLGCAIEDVNIAISETMGLEHHLWLRAISRRLGREWSHCLRVAFEMWHSDPLNSGKAADLSREIAHKVFG